MEDQRWTLARIAEVIRRLFEVSYSLRGVLRLLHRIVWSVQVPAHRAVERNEAAVTAWREGIWLDVGKRHGARAHGWSSRTRPASRAARRFSPEHRAKRLTAQVEALGYQVTLEQDPPTT